MFSESTIKMMLSAIGFDAEAVKVQISDAKTKVEQVIVYFRDVLLSQSKKIDALEHAVTGLTDEVKLMREVLQGAATDIETETALISTEEKPN